MTNDAQGSGRWANAAKRINARSLGYVQGIGYRAFVVEEARRLRLVGFVRNCADGSVETVAEGSDEVLRQFVAALRRGPSGAGVSEVEAAFSAATGEFPDFRIRW